MLKLRSYAMILCDTKLNFHTCRKLLNGEIVEIVPFVYAEKEKVVFPHNIIVIALHVLKVNMSCV